MTLLLRGRVAAKLGDNIDTDIIYPGRYLNITDREKTAEHLFELAYPGLRETISSGELLVAGKNFGCGSSREQATAAIKYAGIAAVVAGSFARIFYRNSINLGLPALVSPEAAAAVEQGAELEVDVGAGVIRDLTTGKTYQAAPLDARAVELLGAGGLIQYPKTKYAAS